MGLIFSFFFGGGGYLEFFGWGGRGRREKKDISRILIVDFIFAQIRNFF